MQTAMWYLTWGIAGLNLLSGAIILVSSTLDRNKRSAREGYVYLAAGLGWSLCALWRDSWNWGIPQLLIVATAWNWWDSKKAPTTPSNDKS